MKHLIKAAWVVLAVCLVVRVGAEVVAPALAPLIVLVFVASIFFWLVARH